MEMEWSVYLIRCRNGSLYTGITNDIERRFQEHVENGKRTAKYLRGKGPLALVFQAKVGDKSSALRIERKIKRLPKAKKEALLREHDLLLEFLP